MTSMRRALLLVVLAVMLIPGCVRRSGQNSDCKWPGESPRQHTTPSHLSADAEFAEDLAIRYADVHHGLRTQYYVSGEEYDAAREKCMASLFEQIAKEHGVPAGQVAAALGHNRGPIDAAENLPVGLLYLAASLLLGRWLWRRYPVAEHGWIAGSIVVLFLSLVMALGVSMLGEMWSWSVETHRIGNDHISYRAQRLWWPEHRYEMLALAAVIFWLAAWLTARRAVRTGPGASSSART
jgi:hypothetical protein